MKKVSVIICALLFVMITTDVCAAAIKPMYTGISDLSCSLSFSGGKASCIGDVTVDESYTASLTVTLQRKVDSVWKKVDSWKSSGTVWVSASGTATVPKGYQYRVVASVTVKDSTGNTVDSASITDIKTY